MGRRREDLIGDVTLFPCRYGEESSSHRVVTDLLLRNLGCLPTTPCSLSRSGGWFRTPETSLSRRIPERGKTVAYTSSHTAGRPALSYGPVPLFPTCVRNSPPKTSSPSRLRVRVPRWDPTHRTCLGSKDRAGVKGVDLPPAGRGRHDLFR